MVKKSFSKSIGFLLFIVLLLSFTNATTYISNSQEWTDVYSVMLRSSFDGTHSMFLNEPSISAITRTVDVGDDVEVFESNNPFIPNLDSQLSALDYNVVQNHLSDDFSMDLDIESGKYILISKDNPKISVSVPPLALKLNAWVLFVDSDNVADIKNKIQNADYVLAVGEFTRDVVDVITPYLSEKINNKNIYADSQDISKKLGVSKNVILADGSAIESEFFMTSSPVLLSGLNKILDDTYNFLEDEDVQNVVIVGNALSVVGEQIRERSNKKISVFVKFGQSDLDATGRVYALTFFAFPESKLDLKINNVIYDSDKGELAVYYDNTGNAGLYFLGSLTVVNGDDEELASISDPEVYFLGETEILPITYPINISENMMDDNTSVKFYVSYGQTPVTLDTFLTSAGKYGPPYSLKLNLGDLENDISNLEVEDVTYYKSYKRLGVSIKNNADVMTYYAVKIPEIIVNGVPTSLFKIDSIKPNTTKITYLPVELDAIDIEENSDIGVKLQYGMKKGILVKPYSVTETLEVQSGISTTLIVIIVAVILLLILVVGLILKKK